MAPFGVVRHSSGALEQGLDAHQIADALGERGAVGWLDLEEATSEEICALEGLFGFHPLAIEDAQNPETRPKIEEYDSFLVVVTRGINHNPGATALGRGLGYDYPHDRVEKVSEQELLPDAVAGERFYGPDESEATLRDRLEAIRRARGR